MFTPAIPVEAVTADTDVRCQHGGQIQHHRLFKLPIGYLPTRFLTRLPSAFSTLTLDSCLMISLSRTLLPVPLR